VTVVGHLNDRGAAGGEHAGNLGKLRRWLRQVVHHPHHRHEVKLTIGEREVVSLHLGLRDVRAFKHFPGSLQLAGSGLGECHLVGERSKQDAQAAEPAPDVGGTAKVLALEEAPDRDVLGGIFVVAIVPVLRVVISTLVLVGYFFALLFGHRNTLATSGESARGLS